jgi:hypothetical protein
VLLHDGDPGRRVVLLPGARYLSQAPLLWFARETAQAHGWSVAELDETAPEGRDPFEWMPARAKEILDETDARHVCVVGKSLGSVAAPLVADRGLPAVWLTPLLVRPEVVEALARSAAPALAIGSPDDPTWGEGTLPENPALETLELPGLDHSLQVSGDPRASLDALGRVVERVGAFLGALRGASPRVPPSGTP